MALEPSLHLGMLVGPVVVHHQVQRRLSGEFLMQMAQEFQELPVPLKGIARLASPPKRHRAGPPTDIRSPSSSSPETLPRCSGSSVCRGAPVRLAARPGCRPKQSGGVDPPRAAWSRWPRRGGPRRHTHSPQQLRRARHTPSVISIWRSVSLLTRRPCFSSRYSAARVGPNPPIGSSAVLRLAFAPPWSAAGSTPARATDAQCPGSPPAAAGRAVSVPNAHSAPVTPQLRAAPDGLVRLHVKPSNDLDLSCLTPPPPLVSSNQGVGHQQELSTWLE